MNARYQEEQLSLFDKDLVEEAVPLGNGHSNGRVAFSDPELANLGKWRMILNGFRRACKPLK